MVDEPENLTDSQRLLRKVDELAQHMGVVRLYLGMLCLLVLVGLILFGLWLFGVITVEVKPVVSSRF